MTNASCSVLLPGDIYPLHIISEKAIVGPGLKVRRSTIDKISLQPATSYFAVSSRCGIVKNVSNSDSSSESKPLKESSFWLHYRQKRYVPAIGESVIGQVVQKTGENYKLEVGCAELAMLPWLNFDGATKRNKPNIKIGDLVYARLTQTIEPELTCISKEETASSRRCLGLLPNGGYVLRLNSNLTSKLKNKEFPLLKLIGKEIPCEICVGDNGWVWFKAHNVKETIAILRMIENSEYVITKDLNAYVKRFIDEMKGFAVGE